MLEPVVSVPLGSFFTLQVFQDGKDIIPLFKDKHPENSRLESLTPTPRQVMEQTLLETISQPMKENKEAMGAVSVDLQKGNHA